MNFISFRTASTPILHAGPGMAGTIGEIIKMYGERILLITGAKSFDGSDAHLKLFEQLKDGGFEWQQYKVGSEPSPHTIDSAVSRFAAYNPMAVLAVGGGSVLDAGKAISAMIPLNESVKGYIERVGSNIHPGVKLPLIAVPTTSGTGSESTRNAVLSEVGVEGYKRSLRHVNFVSNATILDPHLMVTCPPRVTAYSGMDAFTQLLESYLSSGSNFFSDLLAQEGLKHIASSLRQAYRDGDDLDARLGMAIAAYLSGITLTNVGLGVVHGLAAVIGGYKNIPHGVICSALMPSANKITVRLLRTRTDGHLALAKYAAAGRIFCDDKTRSEDYYTDYLVELIAQWVTEMKIPRLSNYEITRADIAKFAKSGESKNNPVPFSFDEMTEMLEEAI
ncbi:MAG: iron-containing alcohol dehydrogenase [Chryseolinea sp.]